MGIEPQQGAGTSPLAVVRPEWVDSYGHMNMAFYLVVFDQATDVLWARLGLDAPFKRSGFGTFAAETWVRYVREVRDGMPLACASEVLAYDGKRLLVLHRMRHATEGWLVAENEVLFLCVDLAARRVIGWPDGVVERFSTEATGRPARRLSLNRLREA